MEKTAFWISWIEDWLLISLFILVYFTTFAYSMMIYMMTTLWMMTLTIIMMTVTIALEGQLNKNEPT